MTEKVLKKGQVALAMAMIAAGHYPAAADRATGSKSGVIANVLYGHRGVGRALGKRLQSTYGVNPDWFDEPAVETALPKVPEGPRGAAKGSRAKRPDVESAPPPAAMP